MFQCAITAILMIILFSTSVSDISFQTSPAHQLMLMVDMACFGIQDRPRLSWGSICDLQLHLVFLSWWERGMMNQHLSYFTQLGHVNIVTFTRFTLHKENISRLLSVIVLASNAYNCLILLKI